ncbi:MAG TPA: hypothetical protein VGL97_09825 [Bryobacteraceae bacterium]|jgi:hypothetical protein
MSKNLLPCLLLVSASVALLGAHDELNRDQLKLLQDSGGWEYTKIESPENGIQTEHTCFDGTPHPDACSGTLTLASNNTFVQKVNIHHESVARHGTYQLDGDQLAFFDEFGTQDGPYTISIDTEKKSMSMQMPQVHMELELESEYHKASEEKH